jgi:hypothetical protein
MIYLPTKYNGLCVVLWLMESPSLSAKYNTKPRTKVWGFVVFATSLDVSIEARGSWGEVCTSNTVLCNLLEF